MIPATANQKNDQRNEKEAPDKFEGWQDMPTPWLIHLAENFLLVVILAGSSITKAGFRSRPHGLRHTPSPQVCKLEEPFALLCFRFHL